MEPSEPPVLPMPAPIAKIRKGSHFAFMPDEEHVLVAGASRAWMVSLATGDLLFEYEKPARFVREIAVSDDGAIVAMALSCERVFLYDAQTGKKTCSLKVGDGADVSGLLFAPGSHTLLHASRRILTAIDKATDGDYSVRPISVLEVWPDRPMYYAVAFAASGDRFACFWTGHGTQNISLLECLSGSEIYRQSWKVERWQPHSHDQLCFTPDNQALLLTNPDGLVTLHSSTNGKSETAEISLLAEVTAAETTPKFYLSNMCFSPDGKLLAYKMNGILGLWAWPSGECLGKWKASEATPYFDRIGFSNSGRELVISPGGSSSGIFVYRTADFINSDLG